MFQLRGTLVGLVSGLGLLSLLGPGASGAGAASHRHSAQGARAAGRTRFHSEPWLHPYAVHMSSDPDTSSGDIFLAPRTTRGGLMILNARGQLVWFRSLAPEKGNNLEVQTYRGKPVLTWWQGHRDGRNKDVIANTSYRVLAVVRAGHGCHADPHDFLIAPHGRAWLLADRNVNANLTGLGGPRHGIVRDTLIQEIDISTGKVLWQWDAYRHIPLNASNTSPGQRFYDAYHLNSIQLLPGGDLLVSSRNTWSVYEISIRTHRVLWTLGGKYSNFRVSPGARFEWQHAASLSGNTLTLFDDADWPQEEAQSSAKVIRLALRQRTATLVHAYVHSPPLLSPSQGNAQRLPNGNVFVGWGAEPDFSEYTPSGRQIMTGSLALGVTSYRAVRFRWSARPPGRPAMAARPSAHGKSSIWASWNGATEVASWRVLGGSSKTGLHTIARKGFYSFETQINLGSRPRYVEVQALNRRGRVLGTSAVRSLGRAASPAATVAARNVIPFPGTPDASPSSTVIFSSLSQSQLRSVTVHGSRSGPHRGRLVRLPAGAGTAFVPRRRFVPGERVSVEADLSSPAAGAATGEPGASHVRFSFGVEVRRQPRAPVAAHAARGRGPVQRFHSEPGLHPPVVRMTPDSDTRSGDIMLTPEHSPQTGPMILNAHGQLLWFQAVNAPGDLDAFNLQVQRYAGRPVLTWWRGAVPGQPSEDLIMNTSYRTEAVVRAVNGYTTDEHEFQITPSGAAYITSYAPVQANLSSVGGPSNGTVMDNQIQEIDISTGQLLWQWSAFGHVPLSDSYAKPHGSNWYDYFHMNSIQPLPDGNLLVSGRNTWGVYLIDRATGRIIWTIGGKHSNFRIKRDARFAWQHDARLSGSTLSLFDDAFGGRQGRQQASQSSAKFLRVNQGTRTVSLIARYTHTPHLLTALEGSVERLPNHDVFVGWGGAPDFTEYAPGGRQIFNGSFAEGVDSYRSFRFPWHAHPLTAPSLAVSPGPGGNTTLWMSWNGATNVASWRVRGGRKARLLSGLRRVGWAGFETAVTLSSQPRYLAVQALNSRGRVLGSSRVHALPRHVDIFGERSFVSASTGNGTVPVGCFTRRTCHVRVKVSSKEAGLAHTAPAKVFSGRGAFVPFKLSASGLAALDSASNHRLAVKVRIRDSSGAVARRNVVLVPFSVSGPGPARHLHQVSTLHIVGANEFVSSGGSGAVLTACYAPAPCQVRATVSARGSQIAAGQTTIVGVNELAYVPFQLTAAGSSLVANAPGNQLAAHIVVDSGRQSATGDVALIRYQ